jgi:hypothetical protein
MANRKSLIVQANLLNKDFPQSVTKVKKDDRLIWESTIQPTPLSAIYTIQLECKYQSKSQELIVKVTNPFPLPLADGKDKLPHVYSHEKQYLCLYYHGDFNYNKQFVKTIIPWTSEWLLHYEAWACTGVWNGGGIDY